MKAPRGSSAHSRASWAFPLRTLGNASIVGHRGAFIHTPIHSHLQGRAESPPTQFHFSGGKSRLSTATLLGPSDSGPYQQQLYLRHYAPWNSPRVGHPVMLESLRGQGLCELSLFSAAPTVPAETACSANVHGVSCSPRDREQFRVLERERTGPVAKCDCICPGSQP